jgi:2-C-methyl-D-erythritol 4-phosphate cytidylyltransferase
MQAVAIIPAAGLGTRMGLPAESGAPARKQFLQIGEAPVIVHTLRKFIAAETIDSIVVAVRDEDREELAELIADHRFAKPVRIAPGGRNRQESVQNALQAVGADVEIVAVHDAVRPFISAAIIDRAVRQAAEDGAVILGMPAVDTVKQVTQKVVQATLPRERIMMAQTPQVFRADLLRRAFEVARRDGFTGTDEASLVEHLGEDVHVMRGSWRNIKITRREDIPLAEFLLATDGAPFEEPQD